ncbi:MAG: tryptophan synthase subunit alpha [Pseudomonadales bacterium]|nr:tryptophan synthase subunit alpha [Pseudomonadales bacterium]
MQLNDYIAERRQQKKLLVMTHVVCGYPSFEDNWRELEIMAGHGVDLVELQFPFSEPSADGPLFVKANQESLAHGTTVEQCFAFMARVAAHFPFRVLMMGYYNTAFKLGHAAFVDKLAAAGGVGFILPDLPIEEATELFALAAIKDLVPIILMTPTSSAARLRTLAAAAKGFVYAVARKGVTGTATSMDEEVGVFLARCRATTSLPLAVGFGVSTREDMDFIAAHADIAIIGTAALRAWEANGEQGLKDFFAGLGMSG